MGSNESHETQSIFQILFGVISQFIHFTFVIFSKLFFTFSRSSIEGLQSELVSTNKESECVRQRLRYQDEQLEKVKESKDLSAEEEQTKYGEKK